MAAAQTTTECPECGAAIQCTEQTEQYWTLDVTGRWKDCGSDTIDVRYYCENDHIYVNDENGNVPELP